MLAALFVLGLLMIGCTSTTSQTMTVSQALDAGKPVQCAIGSDFNLSLLGKDRADSEVIIKSAGNNQYLVYYSRYFAASFQNDLNQYQKIGGGNCSWIKKGPIDGTPAEIDYEVGNYTLGKTYPDQNGNGQVNVTCEIGTFTSDVVEPKGIICDWQGNPV